MVSKNNIKQKIQSQAKRVPHYGIRKLSVGVASVLLGTTMFALCGVAHADTNTGANNNGQAITTAVQTKVTSQTQNSLDQSAVSPSQSSQSQETSQNVTSASSQAESTVASNVANTSAAPASSAEQSVNNGVSYSFSKDTLDFSQDGTNPLTFTLNISPRHDGIYRVHFDKGAYQITPAGLTGLTVQAADDGGTDLIFNLNSGTSVQLPVTISYLRVDEGLPQIHYDAPLSAGTYTKHITIYRDDKPIDQASFK